jgi:hypothetical protein
MCSAGCFRDGIAWGQDKLIAVGRSSRKSPGFEVESQGYLTVMGYDGSFLPFRNPGKRRTRLLSMQAGSPPKGTATSLRVLSCCSIVKLRASLLLGVGWHTFRHTVGTMLAEMGEHQLMIRDYLRHSDLHVTNKYLQATTKSKRLAQGKLVDAILPGGVLSGSKSNLIH